MCTDLGRVIVHQRAGQYRPWNSWSTAWVLGGRSNQSTRPPRGSRLPHDKPSNGNEDAIGTYNISLATDAVGNVMVADNTNTVAVDTENPTATVSVGTPVISDSDLVQEVTVTYDEVMSVTPVPIITFSGGTWTAVSGTESWDTTTKWKQSFEITDNGEEITDVDIRELFSTNFLSPIEKKEIISNYIPYISLKKAKDLGLIKTQSEVDLKKKNILEPILKKNGLS